MHCKDVRKISVRKGEEADGQDYFTENCRSSGVQAVRCLGHETGNGNLEMYMKQCWCQQLQRKAKEG